MSWAQAKNERNQFLNEISPVFNWKMYIVSKKRRLKFLYSGLEEILGKINFYKEAGSPIPGQVRTDDRGNENNKKTVISTEDNRLLLLLLLLLLLENTLHVDTRRLILQHQAKNDI